MAKSGRNQDQAPSVFLRVTSPGINFSPHQRPIVAVPAKERFSPARVRCRVPCGYAHRQRHRQRFAVRSRDSIRDDNRYGGLRLRLNGRIANMRCAVQIDVGRHGFRQRRHALPTSSANATLMAGVRGRRFQREGRPVDSRTTREASTSWCRFVLCPARWRTRYWPARVHTSSVGRCMVLRLGRR